MNAPAPPDHLKLVLPLPQELELAVHEAAKLLRSMDPTKHAELADRLLMFQSWLSTWQEPAPVETPPPATRPSALVIELLTCHAVLEHGLWFIGRARDQATLGEKSELARKLEWLLKANERILPVLLDGAYLDGRAS